MKTLSCLILALLSAILLTTPALAYNYRYTTMDVPGYPYTELNGINDAGQIVGSCSIPAQDVWHGVLYSGGHYSTFDVPRVTGHTEAKGIDALGRIVGNYLINGVYHGYSYDHGAFLNPLDFPKVTDTFASGINTQSKIVGYCFGGPDGEIGFSYSGGSFSPIKVPEAEVTLALGINDAGVIVGSCYMSGVVGYGFLFNNTYTILHNPAAKSTEFYGINTSNQIVGACTNQDNTVHGFLYDGKTFTTIEPPGAAYSVATGINGRGQIVGIYQDQANNTHGFLATPVTGSAALYLLLLLD